MFDGPFMLLVNWTIVDIIHSKDNMFLLGVKIMATDDSKLSDSPSCPTACIFPYSIKGPASIIHSCDGC